MSARPRNLAPLACVLCACTTGGVGGGGGGGDQDGAGQGGGGGPADRPPASDTGGGQGGAGDAAGVERSGLDGPSGPACPGGGSSGSGGMKGKSTRMAGAAKYVAYTPPSYDGSAPVPLFVFLHGQGQEPDGWYPLASDLADKYGFIAIAPRGTGPGPNWYIIDDQPTVEKAIADAQMAFNVCGKRIYLAGGSAGGTMAYVYGFTHSAELAAFGTWAGVDFGTVLMKGYPDKATRKLPVDIHIGTADSAYSSAKLARDELGKRGYPVYYHELPGVGHTFESTVVHKVFAEMWTEISPSALP